MFFVGKIVETKNQEILLAVCIFSGCAILAQSSLDGVLMSWKQDLVFLANRRMPLPSVVFVISSVSQFAEILETMVPKLILKHDFC